MRRLLPFFFSIMKNFNSIVSKEILKGKMINGNRVADDVFIPFGNSIWKKPMIRKLIESKENKT